MFTVHKELSCLQIKIIIQKKLEVIIIFVKYFNFGSYLLLVYVSNRNDSGVNYI